MLKLLAKFYLAAWKPFYSMITDRPSERAEALPALKSTKEVWDYIRQNIVYTGNPGIPYLEKWTTGFFDRYTHPLRIAKAAEVNRNYRELGYQAFWPYHVFCDCDSVALFAYCVIRELPEHKAEFLTLLDPAVKMSHVVVRVESPAGSFVLDTNGLHELGKDETPEQFFKKIYNVEYESMATKLPFYL